jgi:hypothetical protein
MYESWHLAWFATFLLLATYPHSCLWPLNSFPCKWWASRKSCDPGSSDS